MSMRRNGTAALATALALVVYTALAAWLFWPAGSSAEEDACRVAVPFVDEAVSRSFARVCRTLTSVSPDLR